MFTLQLNLTGYNNWGEMLTSVNSRMCFEKSLRFANYLYKEGKSCIVTNRATFRYNFWWGKQNRRFLSPLESSPTRTYCISHFYSHKQLTSLRQTLAVLIPSKIYGEIS